MGEPANGRRPRLLVLNQYYWPGVEATANLLSELCAALASDYDVTAVVGAAHGEPERSVRGGVTVLRVQSTTYDRTQLSRRAANYLTYVAGAVRKGLASPRPDVVLCMTDPPFIGAAAQLVARRFRVPLVVVSQDVFPEIAVRLGRLRSPTMIALLRTLIALSLRHADRVVVIGETMRRRIEEKGVDPARIRVIPNWGDAERITPQPRDNPWAREHGLTDRFVVMHSGNVGHAQDLDTLIRAAALLRDLDDLRIVIVGTGARYVELSSLADVLEVDSVSFLPYQPREVLPESLGSADVHFVGLARGLAGFIVPSRIWGVLAAGRPVLAAADEDSETVALVRETECGIAVPPGEPLRLAEAIRACYDGMYDLEAMGRRARAYAEAKADRSFAVARYRAVLEEVRDDHGG
jgi:glycosyltransferase involved in cell wall biosynthesis